MIVTLATSQGTSFQVDAEDVPLLAQFTWLWVRSLTRGKYTDFGVLSSLSIGGHPCMLDLRKLIMGDPPQLGMRPYSIDGDLAHLEKANLAWLDVSTSNHRNAKVKGHHGYRGIGPDSHTNQTWGFAIGTSARGWGYRNPQEAALAYDSAVRKRFGRWGIVNFPEPNEPGPTGLVFAPLEGPLRATDGNVLQVDPENLPVLSRHRWQPGADGYWTKIGRVPFQLAYLILGRPGGGGHVEIAWRDGDPRNCMRENLLWRNTGPSSFRGVRPEGTQWIASLKTKDRIHRMGPFDTPEEAARAYDKVVEEVRGPRARLNFPQEHGQPGLASIKGL